MAWYFHLQEIRLQRRLGLQLEFRLLVIPCKLHHSSDFFFSPSPNSTFIYLFFSFLPLISQISPPFPADTIINRSTVLGKVRARERRGRGMGERGGKRICKFPVHPSSSLHPLGNHTSDLWVATAVSWCFLCEAESGKLEKERGRWKEKRRKIK